MLKRRMKMAKKPRKKTKVLEQLENILHYRPLSIFFEQ